MIFYKNEFGPIKDNSSMISLVKISEVQLADNHVYGRPHTNTELFTTLTPLSPHFLDKSGKLYPGGNKCNIVPYINKQNHIVIYDLFTDKHIYIAISPKCHIKAANDLILFHHGNAIAYDIKNHTTIILPTISADMTIGYLRYGDKLIFKFGANHMHFNENVYKVDIISLNEHMIVFESYDDIYIYNANLKLIKSFTYRRSLERRCSLIGLNGKKVVMIEDNAYITYELCDVGKSCAVCHETMIAPSTIWYPCYHMDMCADCFKGNKLDTCPSCYAEGTVSLIKTDTIFLCTPEPVTSELQPANALSWLPANIKLIKKNTEDMLKTITG